VNVVLFHNYLILLGAFVVVFGQIFSLCSYISNGGSLVVFSGGVAGGYDPSSGAAGR
jgi:hypothetical protein